MWHLEPSSDFSFEAEELQKEEALCVPDWGLGGEPSRAARWLLVQKGWAEPPVTLLAGWLLSCPLQLLRKAWVWAGKYKLWVFSFTGTFLSSRMFLAWFILLPSALICNMLSYWVMIINLCCLTFPDSWRLFWRARMPAELPGDVALSFLLTTHLSKQTPFLMWWHLSFPKILYWRMLQSCLGNPGILMTHCSSDLPSPWGCWLPWRAWIVPWVRREKLHWLFPGSELMLLEDEIFLILTHLSLCLISLLCLFTALYLGSSQDNVNLEAWAGFCPPCGVWCQFGNPSSSFHGVCRSNEFI